MTEISKSAVERAIDQAANSPAVVPAEQLPLIPTEAARADTAKYQPTGRGGGRPAGSRNRRTVEMARYLLANYRHPLVGLAEIYSRPVGVLAAELGCTKLEAFQAQLTAMRELAPYVAQKMPTMIDARHLLVDETGHDQGALLSEIQKIAGELGLKPADLGLTIDASPVESKSEENQ